MADAVVTSPLKALLSQSPRTIHSPPLYEIHRPEGPLSLRRSHPRRMQRALLAAGPAESTIQIVGTLEIRLQRDPITGTLGSNYSGFHCNNLAAKSSVVTKPQNVTYVCQAATECKSRIRWGVHMDHMTHPSKLVSFDPHTGSASPEPPPPPPSSFKVTHLTCSSAP